MNIWSKDFRQRCQNSLGPWDLQIFRADWCSKVFIPSLKKLTFIKQIIHAGKLKWLGEEKGAFWMTLHWTSSWFSHGFKSQPKAFATGEVCAVPLRGAVQWTRNLWRECLDGALWTGAMMGRVFLELMISQTAKPPNRGSPYKIQEIHRGVTSSFPCRSRHSLPVDDPLAQVAKSVFPHPPKKSASQQLKLTSCPCTKNA